MGKKRRQVDSPVPPERLVRPAEAAPDTTPPDRTRDTPPARRLPEPHGRTRPASGTRHVAGRAGGPSGLPARTSSDATPRPARLRRYWPAIGLVLLAVLVYAPVRHHGFVSLDDTAYVSENAHVIGGLNAESVWWAFTGFSAQAANWHPVTWLSHMLDVQVFGLDAGRHHLVNVLLHALNSALLFVLLATMTGRTWPSAMAAALFGVHPLHVESVAWIAERKDVLSTLFWLLTTLAYVRHVRRPGPGRRAAVLVLYALGLMAKPMLVTLPVTLLLLDWWPLGRLGQAAGPANGREASQSWRRWLPLVVEKWPLFLLAASSSAITVIAQHRGGAVTTLETVPLAARAANACLSCANYLRQMMWPSGLSLYYPHPGASVSYAGAGLALLVLCALAWLGWRIRRSRPHLGWGIAWFLVTLAPVLGLVQVGLQARADRYTYIPLIGPLAALVWELAWLTGASVGRRLAATALAAVVIATLGGVARAQVERWSDEESLWNQALEENPRNFFAHYSLGQVLLRRGHPAEATRHLEQATELAPWFASAHNAMGMALSGQGRMEAAIDAYERALRLDVHSVEARANLGLALEQVGQVTRAVDVYREALRLEPARATLHVSLAHALGSQGDVEGALSETREAIRLQPSSAPAHAYLGRLLSQKGQQDEALAALTRAIEIDPDQDEARALVGSLLIGRGKGEEGLEHLRAAVRLRPDSATSRQALGAALAAAGRLDEAIAQYAEAVRLSPSSSEAHDQLGLCLARAGRLAEAIEQLSEAVRLEPRLEAGHVHLGMALAASGNLTAAAARLREALRINPANRDAQAGLAAIATMTGQRR